MLRSALPPRPHLDKTTPPGFESSVTTLLHTASWIGSLFFVQSFFFCLLVFSVRCSFFDSLPFSLSLSLSPSVSLSNSIVRIHSEFYPSRCFSGRALHPRLLDKAARCLAALARHSNGMVNELMNHVQKQVLFLGAGGGGGGSFRGGRSRKGLPTGHGGCILRSEGIDRSTQRQHGRATARILRFFCVPACVCVVV